MAIMDLVESEKASSQLINMSNETVAAPNFEFVRIHILNEIYVQVRIKRSELKDIMAKSRKPNDMEIHRCPNLAGSEHFEHYLSVYLEHNYLINTIKMGAIALI